MKLRFYTEEKVVILENADNFEEINFSVDRKTSFFYQTNESGNWNEVIIEFDDEKDVFIVGRNKYKNEEHLVLCADSDFSRFFSIAHNDIYDIKD